MNMGAIFIGHESEGYVFRALQCKIAAGHSTQKNVTPQVMSLAFIF